MGIEPSSLPGFGDPPTPRRSHSLGIQSVTSLSVGVPMSLLVISDTQSVVSGETSGKLFFVSYYGAPDSYLLAAQGRRSTSKGKSGLRGSSRGCG